MNYGPAYDLAIQQLVCEFLSRLEQLLPVPDYAQVMKQLPGPFLQFFCVSVSNLCSRVAIRPVLD